MIKHIHIKETHFVSNGKSLAIVEKGKDQPSKIVKRYDITETGSIRFHSLKDRDEFFLGVLGIDIIYGPFYIDELISLQYEKSPMETLMSSYGDDNYIIELFSKLNRITDVTKGKNKDD